MVATIYGKDNRLYCSKCGQVVHETQKICPCCKEELILPKVKRVVLDNEEEFFSSDSDGVLFYKNTDDSDVGFVRKRGNKFKGEYAGRRFSVTANNFEEFKKKLSEQPEIHVQELRRTIHSIIIGAILGLLLYGVGQIIFMQLTALSTTTASSTTETSVETIELID